MTRTALLPIAAALQPLAPIAMLALHTPAGGLIAPAGWIIAAAASPRPAR